MKRTFILGSILGAVMALSSLTPIGWAAAGAGREAEGAAAIPGSAPGRAAVTEPESEEVTGPSAVFEAAEVLYYTEEEAVMVAKLLYRECGGVASDTEKACVVWTVCNRVDSADFCGTTVAEVVTERYQFAYCHNTPVEAHLYALAVDVLSRWNTERNGQEDVGRVLPPDYTFFSGDGEHNYFRNQFRGGSVWDYSLESPYES